MNDRTVPITKQKQSDARRACIHTELTVELQYQ